MVGSSSVYALVLMNLFISFTNAWVVGRSWADVQAIGSSWQRLVLASTYIMSGCGFTWCYLVIFAMFASGSGYIDSETLLFMLQLGYAVIILPVLGTGIAIWLDSVTTAIRHGGIGNIGTATYNTFAQSHNTIAALRNLMDIFKILLGFFKGGRSKGKAQLMVVVLVVIALLLGFITAYVIAMMSAGVYSEQVINDMKKHAPEQICRRNDPRA